MSQISYEYVGRDFNASRLSEFKDVISRDFYSADYNLIQNDSQLHLRLTHASAGYVPISTHSCIGGRGVTKRSWKDVRSGNIDLYLIWIPVKGSVSIEQGARSTEIQAGQIALSSSCEPLCIGTNPDESGEHKSFQVVAPAHFVNLALADPKRLCALPFASEHGGARVARDMFLSLYEEVDAMDRGSAESLALAAISALMRSIRHEEDNIDHAKSVKEGRLQRLLDYLDLHYSDPELTTEKVAAACKISTRYLHYLLKQEGKRFCDYIWQARLNNARQQLLDPSLSRRTIAEVAYSSGFKSSAHFSRAFRKQFDCAPKEARRSAAEQHAAMINEAGANRYSRMALN
ncbi:transcriptional regulator, AraC family [Sphingobium chlorophenolicum L-1]|uniref:Transcriptional regulator, AraC family n=1 Tax=Sphingobium chlorophenolicum L-1 TaxID=690566 RepID=F6F343_SPHCR|nr:helix-turn-helix domain-containing protein [Sphingobium chlorophenolicum]AEG50855.1 transcriptional regulator, AraC family [Sphingobium chlorophenolicum L-1]